jgi:hypothetical protein
MGLMLMSAFAVVAATAFAICVRALLAEPAARRSLSRADGVVEQVQFSRSGQPTGSRATVGFVDEYGQQQRFTTPWSEHPYSEGDTVPVGIHSTEAIPPRLLTTRLLGQHSVQMLHQLL